MNLRELALQLGLSQTTVSRALNGYPEVSEATRKRVRDAADKFSYRPNTRAKGLATGRSMAVGHVIPVSDQHEMVNPIFADVIAGAGEAYADAGYDLVLSLVGARDEAAFYRDLASRGTIDGIIVHGPRHNDPRLPLLKEIGLPFLVHGRSSLADVTYSWVDVNNRSAFYRAAGLLLDLGHRRIGLINGLAGMDFAVRREDGYRRALTERGIHVDPELIAEGEMTEAHGWASAREMLSMPDPPTAFLVSSIISAFGVRRAAAELDIALGSDLSVVVFDDDLSYFRSDGGVPQFTSVRSSVREAGRMAAEMLLDIIREGSDEPRQRLLEAELTIGRSTGPVPTYEGSKTTG